MHLCGASFRNCGSQGVRHGEESDMPMGSSDLTRANFCSLFSVFVEMVGKLVPPTEIIFLESATPRRGMDAAKPRVHLAHLIGAGSLSRCSLHSF